MEPKGSDMADELDEALDAACRANIHPLSEPSDVERRKMRRALEAALPHLLASLSRPSTAEAVAWQKVGQFGGWGHVVHDDDDRRRWEQDGIEYRSLGVIDALAYPSPQGGAEPDDIGAGGPFPGTDHPRQISYEYGVRHGKIKGTHPIGESGRD